jgi:arylsulfatase
MTDAARSVIGTPLPPARTLPFPPKPSGSIAGRTIQESTYSPLPPQRHLGAEAPNVLVILIDDAGPALPAPLGGKVQTPTLDRIRSGGIGFNRFHTTAMCSPTRAALLTGRNHHRVGNGQIAELANDWDGYSGHIPKSSATLAEVLKEYGYATAAWGKWHNTPAEETTKAGPFDRWPTGYGFEYFYGFLAGEASQYEPNLVRNTTTVLPPKTPEEGYHLSEDIADDAIAWLRDHKALAPDQPFLMYWATGAIHGPHHIMKEWADKYAGVFDDGWDAYREDALAGAKAAGWIPEDAVLTPRPESLDGWDDIPEHQKPFQRRLMEVCAGFGEHADVQAGRLVDELERLGYADDTIIIYVWGDNGSSGEGQNGTISELLAQNLIPTTVDQHIAALEELGGLDALGTPATDNQYHAAWAWAGSTPYQGMKLLASHLGGTRNPMFIQWPGRIEHDPVPRTQFHHVIDVVPTIYEILGISHPDTVNGIPQDVIDGISFAYSIDDRTAEDRRRTQYFEIMGSRSIYSNGWMASATGPRLPWVPGAPPGIHTWTPDQDTWELYHLDEDFSQAHDLAAENPEKLAELKELFAIEAARNEVLPIGGGLWVPAMHPELRIAPPYSEWEFLGRDDAGAGVLRSRARKQTEHGDDRCRGRRERERRALQARRLRRRAHLLRRRRGADLRVQPVPRPAHDGRGIRSAAGGHPHDRDPDVIRGAAPGRAAERLPPRRRGRGRGRSRADQCGPDVLGERLPRRGPRVRRTRLARVRRPHALRLRRHDRPVPRRIRDPVNDDG